LIESLFQGCAVFPVTTEGFHTKLPEPHTKTIVWGNQQAAVEIASVWLRGRGLAIVASARVQHQLSAKSIDLTGTLADADHLVNLGRTLNVDLVVYVDTTIRHMVLRRPMTEELPHRAGEKETLYYVQVSAYGVDATTGAVIWRGMARLPYPVHEVEEEIGSLTCRALVTALGAEDVAPGTGRSDSCLAGSRPSPNEEGSSSTLGDSSRKIPYGRHPDHTHPLAVIVGNGPTA
jgi:hypothetical protein